MQAQRSFSDASGGSSSAPPSSSADSELTSGSAYIDLGLNGSSMVSKDEKRDGLVNAPVPWLVVSREQQAPQAAPQAAPPQQRPAAAFSWKDVLKNNAKSSFQSCLDEVFI